MEYKQTALKVLVLSRNYPNNIDPYSAIWVKHWVSYTSRICDIRVVAPVPYCPPLPGFIGQSHFRNIVRYESNDNVNIYHPRFFTGPGYSLHEFESEFYYWSIVNFVDNLRKDFPFDLIHAHFGYPDGVVAARLGHRYGVPFIISEHALWRPWMDDFPRACRKAVWASRESSFHIVASRSNMDSIVYFTGKTDNLRLIPIGVDTSIFFHDPIKHKRDPDQIIFVGFINYTKGIDILLQAMRLLVERRPTTKLVLVGGGFYQHKRLQAEEFRKMAGDMGLDKYVEFTGRKPHEEVADYMRKSAVLVLPSRRESFGSVLVEALACGTPVVATRCGGPEDIINEQVGYLVSKEDPQELASALEHVLNHHANYDAKKLSDYALNHFSWEHIAHQTIDLYHEALEPVSAVRID
jgi:teichuronic acid biosynthesis glycosyltransferase TuaC